MVSADPPKPRRKNKPQDERFILEHAKEFTFTPDSRLVWSRMSQDYGSEYQMPPDEHRCRSFHIVKDNDGGEVLAADYKPLQARCGKWAMRGAAVCVDCANGADSVKKAVRDLLVAAAPALAGKLIAIALEDKTEAKDSIRAILAVLDRAGIRGGIEVGPDVPGWKAVLEEMMTEDGADG